MLNEIRLYICEMLLGWILKIAPKNEEGRALALAVSGYFVWLRHKWKIAESNDEVTYWGGYKR